jgi:protoporphyrinogen oxidase
MKKTIIIMPAGLAFACYLLKLTKGKGSVLVLEKEKEAGGL